jgi:ankyrin repeat protein
MPLNKDLDKAPAPGALLSAVHRNDLEAAQELLRRGADVNERGSNRETPLMWAIFRNDTAMVRLLLDKGARADIKNANGKAALDFVDQYKDKEIALLLRKALETYEMHDTAARRQDILRTHARQFRIKS